MTPALASDFTSHFMQPSDEGHGSIINPVTRDRVTDAIGLLTARGEARGLADLRGALAVYKQAGESDMAALERRLMELLVNPIAWGEAIGYKGTRHGRKRFGPFHRRLLRDILSNGSRVSVLVPRGHAKSTLISVVYVTWSLLRDPGERILVACATLDLAEKLVGEVRDRLQGQLEFLPGFYVKLCDLFPHLQICGASGKPVGTNSAGGPCNAFNVLGRKQTLGKEPSVFAGSVGTSLAGNHPTLAVVDDPSTEQNSKSYGERQKVIEFIQQLEPLMYDMDSPVIHVGTCWSVDDVSTYLRTNKGWHQIRYGVYTEGGDDTICPAFLTYDEARSIQASVRPAFFAAQYLNDPIPGDAPLFSRAMLDGATICPTARPEQAYTLAQLRQDGRFARYREILLFDPVGRMSGEHGSRNGFVVVKPIPAGVLGVTTDRAGRPVEPNRNLFAVVHAHEIAEGLESAVSWIENDLRQASRALGSIWIEKMAQQAAIVPWIQQRGRLAGIDIRAMKPTGRGSGEGVYLRILGVQAAIQRGLIFFPSDGFPGRDSFFHQLSNWPLVDYDDQLMALALLSSTLERTGSGPALPRPFDGITDVQTALWPLNKAARSTANPDTVRVSHGRAW